MECQLEHANITVINMERAIAFITTAFPHFRVRGEGRSDHGEWRKHWLHLGTDAIYIALEETTKAGKTARRPEDETGINHVGFVIEDVEDIQRKMQAAGFACAVDASHPFRKRMYVTDHDRITWEFIEYLSDNLAERNDYTL